MTTCAYCEALTTTDSDVCELHLLVLAIEFDPTTRIRSKR